MSDRKSPRNSQPTALAALLKSVLQNKLPLEPISKELKIWEQWEKSVGGEITKHAQPQYFRNGVLFVHTKHALWATELQYRAPQIRARLNQALGEELVREIQFRLGPWSTDKA